MKTILFSVLVIFLFAITSQAADMGACKDVKVPNPIKVVVPVGPGSSGDVAARLTSEEVKKQFATIGINTNIVIENREGGGGNIGAAAVKNSGKTDGSVLLFSQSPEMLINPRVKEMNTQHKPEDFQPISFVASNAYALVCNKNKVPGVTNVTELLKYIESGKTIDYGHAGLGNFTNLTMLEFARATGVKVSSEPGSKGLYPIAYKSSSQPVTDITGGQIDCMFQSYPQALSSVTPGGPLVIIGTTLDAGERKKPLEQAPAIADTATKYHRMLNWTGYFAPKGVSSSYMNCFNEQVQKALANPTFQTELEKRGYVKTSTDPKTPESFNKLINTGIENMTAFVGIINGDKPAAVVATPAKPETRKKN